MQKNNDSSNNGELMNEEKQNNDKTGLGTVLKLLRIARDLSIKELAKKMNVSAGYLSDVELNNKRPSLEMLDTYSKALEVKKSTILFFYEEGEEDGYDYKKLLLKILQKLVD